MLHRLNHRRGTTLVECALIFPVAFLLLFGLIIGGLGVFRYQQVASLAREGARYASVHGARYEQVTGSPSATPAEIYENAILPKVVGLDPARLSYSVSWPEFEDGTLDKRQGTPVTVRVTYHWIPEAYLKGIQLSSTSTMIISY